MRTSGSLPAAANAASKEVLETASGITFTVATIWRGSTRS